MAAITGDEEVQKLLSKIQAMAENGLAKPAISAGLKVAAKGIKSAVPATLKDAKKAIGWRMNKSKRTGEVMGKAGAAVGMKSAQVKKQADKNFLGRVGHGGVGIGARNMMWWILGTAMRFTGSKRVRNRFARAAGITRMSTGKTVHPTGRMPAQMNPVEEGVQANLGPIKNEISRAATASLLKLVGM